MLGWPASGPGAGRVTVQGVPVPLWHSGGGHSVPCRRQEHTRRGHLRMSPAGGSKGGGLSCSPHLAVLGPRCCCHGNCLRSILLPLRPGRQGHRCPQHPQHPARGTQEQALPQPGKPSLGFLGGLHGFNWVLRGAVVGWGYPRRDAPGEAELERPGKCWQGLPGAVPRQTQLPRGQGLHAARPPTNINHFLIYNMNN